MVDTPKSEPGSPLNPPLNSGGDCKSGEQSLDCGKCGHPESEHNDNGNCMHYEFGGCACFRFVRPEDATPVMRAERLFPRHWNVVYSNPNPFAAGPCMTARCAFTAVRRIMVNIWGTVCEYDVCEAHATEYHGKMMDDFPYQASPLQSSVSPGDDVPATQAHQEGG